ncbi:MAG: hypothetical protein HN855_15580 [Anaerolineae bacterium]|jgi:hypothetical protein|nr:hypothetical protein [Anaerolineae bacterium]MBT7072427.1 hypothetical protein [Anaerolineae bacterium]MBT7326576.1 hypothetical protein [Anaerolineae bacterium]
MGKQKFKIIAEKIIRYFFLGFIVILLTYPIFLPLIKYFPKLSQEDQKAFINLGIITVVFGFLWLLLWIARRASTRVWLKFEEASPVVESVGHRFFAILCGLAFLIGGAYQVFNDSYHQTNEWFPVLELPHFNPSGIAAAPTNTPFVFDGQLSENKAIPPYGFVLYSEEKWDVYPCDIANDEDCMQTTGTWLEVKQVIPDLTVFVSNKIINILSVPEVIFEGEFAEEVKPGQVSSLLLLANYNGQRLHDGSIRIRGLSNGDKITFVGSKEPSGKIIPTHLFGGDYKGLLDLVEANYRALRWIRISGVIMMIFSPIITVFIWRNPD